MSTNGFTRKLAAIFSADVVGYSRLMSDDEAATVGTLTAFRGAMADLILQHRGRVVDSPGDNLLAEFPSVVDAVQCAVAVQKEFKTRNADLPDHRKMEFRIGINLGDVIEDGDRIYGDGVNIAARLESLADPGGVCISRTAYDQIEDKLPLGYQYLGEKKVKNIPKPVRAYRVLLEPQEKPREDRDSRIFSEELPEFRDRAGHFDRPEQRVRFYRNLANFLEGMGWSRKSQQKLRQKETEEMRRMAGAGVRPGDIPEDSLTAEELLERRVEVKLNFYRRLYFFLGLGGLLLIIDLLTSPGKLWFFWPLLPLGLLLVLYWTRYLAFTGEKWEKIREGRGEPSIRFYRGLIIFLCVGAFFLTINLLSSPNKLWFFWPLLPIGFGLLMRWGRTRTAGMRDKLKAAEKRRQGGED
ncbi:MAG: adenylate/guanylate cyclase domain-containing protein [Pseudomonadota bacterium]